eukprot:550436-Amphidinium_carterae.1
MEGDYYTHVPWHGDVCTQIDFMASSLERRTVSIDLIPGDTVTEHLPIPMIRACLALPFPVRSLRKEGAGLPMDW